MAFVSFSLFFLGKKAFRRWIRTKFCIMRIQIPCPYFSHGKFASFCHWPEINAGVIQKKIFLTNLTFARQGEKRKINSFLSIIVLARNSPDGYQSFPPSIKFLLETVKGSFHIFEDGNKIKIPIIVQQLEYKFRINYIQRGHNLIYKLHWNKKSDNFPYILYELLFSNGLGRP